MEPWELGAREAIRDLVARYNANGDSGRFAEVVELFAPDAVMDISGDVRTGAEEILTVFTGARDRSSTRRDPDPAPAPAAAYVRHFTATHQIDIDGPQRARGRLYFQVLTSVGLDHWGRYIDEYRTVDGRWRFAKRSVTVDGYHPLSLFTTAPDRSPEV